VSCCLVRSASVLSPDPAHSVTEGLAAQRDGRPVGRPSVGGFGEVGDLRRARVQGDAVSQSEGIKLP
jgi:hypothetical protein